MFVRWGYCRTSTNTLTVVDKMRCIFALEKFQRCKGWIRILPVFGRICLSIFLQCGHLRARMPIPLLSLDWRLSLKKSSIEDRSVHRDPRTLAVRHDFVEYSTKLHVEQCRVRKSHRIWLKIFNTVHNTGSTTIWFLYGHSWRLQGGKMVPATLSTRLRSDQN